MERERAMPVVLSVESCQWLVGRKAAMWKGSTKLSAKSHSGSLVHASPEARTHLEEVITRHEKQIEAENQPRVYAVGTGDYSLAAVTPWLERIQWLSTYKNVRRDILSQMTILPVKPAAAGKWTDVAIGQGFRTGDLDICSPEQDEAKLACILNAVDLMLDRCETTVLQTSRFSAAL